MAKYRYFVHFTVPNGDGNIELICDEPVTAWNQINAMKDVILEKYPQYPSAVVTNYILLRAEEI